jgi:predicted anti-sigma-YlaC factor YlaD
VTGLSCAEFVELVTAYLEGTLNRETEARFAEHTAECGGCESYLEQIRETIRLVGTLTPERISPQARDELLAAFRDWPRGPADPGGVDPQSAV